jgi:hypothetical protein
MTEPESPSPPSFGQQPPDTTWRNSRAAVIAYFVIGVAIALFAKLVTPDGGAYLIFGLYGLLIDAVIFGDVVTNLTWFLVSSLVFLALLIPALELKAGCSGTLLWVAAIVLWFGWGFLMVLTH